MAGFNQRANYDFLQGLELTQVQVNKYNVCFKFTEGPEINMATAFEHFDADKNVTATYDIEGGTKDFTVQRLLGLKTTDAQIVSEDMLKLVFENGDTVSFLRRNDGYESMTIDGPNGVIVIY